MTAMPSDSESRSPKGESPSSAEAPASSFSQEDVSLPLTAESGEENPSVAPFSLSDQPSPNDKLGFRPYVQAIADFLMNQGTRPPLTLSVEGHWGSGKSSFMKQLQLEVEKKGARTVWFNAWRYDKEDSMLAAFAVALASELGRQQSFMERLGAYANLQKKRFGWRSFAIDLLAKLVFVFFVVFLVYSQPESANSGGDFDFRQDRTETAPDAPQSSAETNVPRRGRTAGPGGTNPAQYAGWSDKTSSENGPFSCF